MDVLKSCAVKFSELLNKKFIITLSNLEVITIVFKIEHFYHLIGFQYLTDLAILKRNKNVIYKEIINNKITYNDVCFSIFIDGIIERINNFEYITEIILSNTIVKFDSKKSYSRINADYVLLRNELGKYIMLFLGKNKSHNNLFPVSFIVREDNNYIYGQKSVSINKIEIIDLIVQQEAAATTETIIKDLKTSE